MSELNSDCLPRLVMRPLTRRVPDHGDSLGSLASSLFREPVCCDKLIRHCLRVNAPCQPLTSPPSRSLLRSMPTNNSYRANNILYIHPVTSNKLRHTPHMITKKLEFPTSANCIRKILAVRLLSYLVFPYLCEVLDVKVFGSKSCKIYIRFYQMDWPSLDTWNTAYY